MPRLGKRRWAILGSMERMLAGAGIRRALLCSDLRRDFVQCSWHSSIQSRPSTRRRRGVYAIACCTLGSYCSKEAEEARPRLNAPKWHSMMPVGDRLPDQGSRPEPHVGTPAGGHAASGRTGRVRRPANGTRSRRAAAGVVSMPRYALNTCSNREPSMRNTVVSGPTKTSAQTSAVAGVRAAGDSARGRRTRPVRPDVIR